MAGTTATTNTNIPVGSLAGYPYTAGRYASFRVLA